MGVLCFKVLSLLLCRSGNPTVHLQNLLLLLPSIRQADSLIRGFWHKVRQEGRVKLKKLLVEMLEANLKPIKVMTSADLSNALKQ